MGINVVFFYPASFSLWVCYMLNEFVRAKQPQYDEQAGDPPPQG